MLLFDVNILIYAHRSEQVHHQFYKDYLETIITDGESFGLTPSTAAGFIKIVTHRNFPGGPETFTRARSVIDTLCELETFSWIFPGVNHWKTFTEICCASKATGKLVTDAQHAAIAIENGATWVTRDSDFKKFQKNGLRLKLITPRNNQG